MRKVAARIAADPAAAPILVDAAFAGEALGAPPHLPETAERTEVAGVVVGLAATAHGGDILFIEATANPGGKGVRLRLTGQLGDVMRESAEAALSWVRANAERFVPGAPALSAGEIHLHVPAGAVPKDGPSAGITIATALVSLARGEPVSSEVAMTGEVTLTGQVLQIGGVRDKVLAAQRAGVNRVVLPRENEADLVDLPPEARDEIEFVLVDSMDEVLSAAFDGAVVTHARRIAGTERQAAATRRR